MAEETTVVKKEEGTATIPPTDTSTVTIDDPEARIAQLEADKAKLIVESANYRVGMMKAKSKNTEDDEESEEDKIERIVNEKLADSKLADIAREQDIIIKQALKENKELKLANMNKTTIPPASMGTHSESTPVTDTTITPEQMAAFKTKGWSDKDIERYKKNLAKYGGR